MKILVFGGFLGAGKTSVIMQMAKYLVADDPGVMSRIVLLENEIGSSSIDDKTLAGTGLKVETLFSGCVCCTMAGEMVDNICYIEKRFDPQWIILEATGMAYPSNVKRIINESLPGLECRLVCIVDAKRWRRMLRVPDLKAFAEDQLVGCDVVLINKCDLVTEEDLKEVEASVVAVNAVPPRFRIVGNREINKETWDEVFSWKKAGE